ncbi:MAG: cyclic nucleotide-binding domain-containing protein [Anaerolinea sp.]|nr:cyclic nucleotide-binding domain-containing protein [Anaerolinea sp.]
MSDEQSVADQKQAAPQQPENAFWQALVAATDPTLIKPKRHDKVISVRLESQGEPYYVLKQPETKTYLRLSEQDFALWWQMDGTRSIKDLLFYSLRRYRSLPIGRLNGLVADLYAGHFLQELPTNLYTQVMLQLAKRQPASRGRRLLNAFLHTEVSTGGLDRPFTLLYQWLQGLFTWQAQALLLLFILAGTVLFGRLVLLEKFALSGNGAYSILSLLAANLFIITVHELGHGLATKHLKRELNRGGFLLYWGMPAFFVDTRDIWLSPRWARIAVSWAGPHSGLLVGSVMGVALTAVTHAYPDHINTIWAVFLYQIGFLAYLSVVINLNPLLELDGYFILMDWLEIPNLRARAIAFWRKELWAKWRAAQGLRSFWQQLNRPQRVFTFYGGLTLVYSTYALALAGYFWQTRLAPFVKSLWEDYGIEGQMLVLAGTAVFVIPAVYFLLQYSWSRIRAGLEWLARRDLLARPDVLALLISLPIFAGIPLLLIGLGRLPAADLWLNLTNWLLHLTAVALLIGVARQLPGSRFQWVIWSLAVTPVGITVAWVAGAPFARDLSLVVAAAGVLAAGVVSGFTVWPRQFSFGDRALMALMFLLGLAYVVLTYLLHPQSWLTIGLVLFGIFPGLIFMTPLFINFLRSRFALPWLLLLLAVLAVPWLQFYPFLHLPVTLLWIYAGSLYLLLGGLAQFARHETGGVDVGAFSERARLVNAFNHFMQAMFASYETVFGGRRLADIQLQMLALGPIDPDASIFDIGRKCRAALLLAVDRLDDLAGTPFTRQAGQAAYDSLPWPEAETLARHTLAEMEWGAQLAQGFILARDRRAQLIRQADIFAGFDQDDVAEVLQIAELWQCRAGTFIAHTGMDARRFFLIESGEVGVFQNGVQTAAMTAGGYFGTMALLDNGAYMSTYRALTSVRALIIRRDRFDPILRANTTLSRQVSSGAQERQLLKQMPLFSSLSPQQLAAIDARLLHKRVRAGEIVVWEGDPRSHLYIVAEGAITALAGNGRTVEAPVVIGRLGPGEHFGEYALFADKPYSATYRAELDTHLLLLDEPMFDELVADCAHMSHYVEQIGSGRLFVTRRQLGPTAVLS